MGLMDILKAEQAQNHETRKSIIIQLNALTCQWIRQAGHMKDNAKKQRNTLELICYNLGYLQANMRQEANLLQLEQQQKESSGTYRALWREK
jgi:hypothetical protein